MRLRARFGGKMITAVVILAACAAGVSFMVFQQGMVLAKDFYIIGVSPNAPLLDDPRFHILHVPVADSASVLKEKRIDVYLTGAALYYRNDDRSQYAAGALKTYLEKNELARLAQDYPLNQAFPLRVEINYLKAPSKDIGSASPLTLADILSKAAKENAAASPPPGGDITEGAGSQPLPPGEAVPNETDEMVRQQLQGLQSTRLIPEFKAEFANQGEVIVPSLMNPPIPLAQVMLAFAYILPIFFISIFFTSGFLEEKMGRKLNILLSAPVTPLQIIIGKMLPYIGYSLLIVILITLVLHGNLLLALAIFFPVILFIFAVYLGVALQYRTFKDQTFFSLVAVTGITGYLVFPAMFVGINDLSYVSPLTLAVQMYRGVDITPYQYMLSTVPMLLIFVLAVTVGSRVFNEEYLLSFRPLHVKVRDAIYYAMNKNHLAISVAVFSLLFIVFTFFELIGDIVHNHTPLLTVGDYLLNLIPYIVSTVAPLCSLLAVLITFGSLNRSSELTAMKATGISLYRVVVPIFVLAAILSAALFAFNESYLPDANRRQEALRAEIKGKPAQTFLRPDRKWISGQSGPEGSPDRIFYYQAFDPDRKIFANLTVFEFDPHTFTLVRRIFATTTHWDANLGNWVFDEGWQRTFSGESIVAGGYQPFSVARFPEIHEQPSYFMKEEKQSQEMTYGELTAYIADLRQSGFDTIRLRVQLDRKLADPAITLVMAILAVPFALSMGRRGGLTGIAIAIAVAISYWVVAGTFSSLGEFGTLPPLLAAWSPDLLFAIAGSYLLLRTPT